MNKNGLSLFINEIKINRRRFAIKGPSQIQKRSPARLLCELKRGFSPGKRQVSAQSMPPRFEVSADVRNVVYVLVGQDETVMQELMPESQGDFKNYMRMNVEMFRRMLVGVLLRITNSYSPPPPITQYHCLCQKCAMQYCGRIDTGTVCATPSSPDEWRDIAS